MTRLKKLPPTHSPGSPGRARVGRDGDDLEPLVTMYGHNTSHEAEPAWTGFTLLCFVIWLAVFVFIMQFSTTLFDTPAVDFLQDHICRHFYGLTLDDSMAAVDCMVTDVQDNLGLITKGSLAFSYLPGMFSARIVY